jgi:predicted O-linked N-acetylglucosamine transferase (SPINDLY family)
MPRGENQHDLHTALSLHQAGKLDQAARLYRQILHKDPDNHQALHYLGVIEASGGNFEQAKALIARSLQHQPANVPFLENYAGILFQAGDYDAALQVCRQALRSNPSLVPFLYIGAVALYKLKRFEEAVEQFDRLLALAPDHVIALNERGSVLAELKRYDAALASFQKALALQPRYAEAHLNSGNLYGVLRRYDEALAAYRRALALNGSLADAWLGCGNVDLNLGACDHALAAFDKALALNPNLAGAWLGRGNALSRLRRYDEAFAAYAKALIQKPDGPFAEGARLDAKIRLCDWSNLAGEVTHLESSIAAGIPTSPFVLLAVAASPRTQLEAARLYGRTEYPAASQPLWRGEKYQHGRIRVAYLSADYGEHPVSYLLAGLLEQHDRRRFETIGLSFRPIGSSAIAARISNSFDRFIDVADRSDRDVAELIKALEVDIAVDLMGYTANSRTPILSYRAAPVQVNYLGYPGTMGADYIDYIIGDKFVVPDAEQQFYSEKIVYLPHTFQVNDSKRAISENTPSRAEVGLPDHAFVFCAFNNSYKILPHVFEVWLRLLQEVAGSVLWLLAETAQVGNNLRREAENRGVDPARLIFAPRIAYADYLARYRLADLFLDTLPFNAGTTASDALWAGLPLVTCPGRAFASRMAGSLLTAIEMPELIAESPADYEALAVKLASDPQLMVTTRLELERNRARTPLFDTELFTRHIEAAYSAIHQRAQVGLEPDHIWVPQQLS